MKYLTTIFAIACMAFGFASITTTHGMASSEYKECMKQGGTWSERDRRAGADPCSNRRNVEIDRIDDIDVAEHEKILSPGGTAVESDHQFADREDGSGGDFGDSGGDFGEGDRAAASTAAE